MFTVFTVNMNWDNHVHMISSKILSNLHFSCSLLNWGPVYLFFDQWDGIHFSDLWGCIVKYFLILCLSLCIYQNFFLYSVNTFLDSFTLFHIMCSLIKKNLVTFLILFIYNSQISRKTLVLFVTQDERDKKTVQS